MDIEVAGVGVVGIVLIMWFASRPLDNFTTGVIIGGAHCVEVSRRCEVTKEELACIVRGAGYNILIRNEVRGKQRRTYTSVYVWPKGAIEERRSLGPLAQVVVLSEDALRAAIVAKFAQIE